MRTKFKQLALSNGGFALVDAADYPKCRPFHWWKTPAGYARCRFLGKQLHCFLLGDAPSGMEIDHRSGNRLDCRRGNLRWATRSQNQANARKRKFTSSKYKGVHGVDGAWKAQIQFCGRKIYIGMFDSEDAASAAYDLKAKELWAAFARLNHPRRMRDYQAGNISIQRLKRRFPEKYCEECGKTFIPYVRHQKYCQRKCTQKVMSRRYHKKLKQRKK